MRFANDFHSWLRHSWKSLANRLTRDPKIVIHGNSCIILYIHLIHHFIFQSDCCYYIFLLMVLMSQLCCLGTDCILSVEIIYKNYKLIINIRVQSIQLNNRVTECLVGGYCQIFVVIRCMFQIPIYVRFKLCTTFLVLYSRPKCLHLFIIFIML